MEDQWVRPGAFEVAPGVHRIPLSLPNDGLRAVNVYAIAAPSGPVLVDSGCVHGPGRAQLSAALRELGHEPRQVQRFLITHHHYDHYTLAIPLRREFGTPISLPGGERAALEAIRAPETQTLTAQMRQLRSHGAGALATAIEAAGSVHDIDASEWELPDDWISPGDAIDVGPRRLTAVATPGHTSGHMSFADLEHGLLFAGDHVLPQITPSIGFEAALGALPLADFLASLQRITELPDLTLLPAHGPAGASTHARARELVEHHDERLAQSAEAVAAGAATAHDVARTLGWTGQRRRFDQLDEFNRMLAVIETAAHLDLLVARGQLDGHFRSEEKLYAPAVPQT